MQNRHISIYNNNIRLVLDILDYYSDLIQDDSYILFIDFYKAFDSLEHDFMMVTLSKFGFGNFFCKAVKTLYTNGKTKSRHLQDFH